MGFFPLLLVQHLAKRGSRRARLMSIQVGTVVIGAGFILFLVALLVVAKLVPEVFPAFGISMALAFLASSVVFALREQRR
jgi:TRAP-type C4-dicarboxylate transport system permease small subunit